MRGDAFIGWGQERWLCMNRSAEEGGGGGGGESAVHQNFAAAPFNLLVGLT